MKCPKQEFYMEIAHVIIQDCMEFVKDEDIKLKTSSLAS